MNPLVSCIMLTYNRLPDRQILLEEAIHSFIMQDYDNKQLIILNDCEQQKIYLRYNNVIVININKRFKTLGEKYNTAIALSDGDFICPWEDDDISLPWRISLSVSKINDKPYWKANKQWFIASGIHEISNCVGHNHSIFTRKSFDEISGYPHISISQDSAIEKEFEKNNFPICREDINKEHWYYIYRWNTGSYHGSAYNDGYKVIGDLPITPGEFYLDPHWEQDYTLLIKNLL